MQRYWLVFLAILFALLGIWTAQPAHAQHPNNRIKCTMPDGTPYAGQDVFVRYEAQSGRVTLVSWQTGDTLQVLEENVWTTRLDTRFFMNSCRYLVVSNGELGAQTTVAYDVYENRRIGELYTAVSNLSGYGVTSDRILVQTFQGPYLWNLATDERLFLDLVGNGLGLTITRLQLDLERGYLTFESPSSPGVLYIWSLTTGQPITSISNGPNAAEVFRRRLGSNWEAIIGGSETPDYAVGSFSSHFIATLWNYDTLEVIRLYRVNRGLGSIVFSPSGRYMAIYGSFVQVYDLSQPQPLSPIAETDVRNLYSYRSRYGRFSPDETQLQFLIFSQNSSRDRYAPLELRYVSLAAYDIATEQILYNESYDPDLCQYPDWRSANISGDFFDWACATLSENVVR